MARIVGGVTTSHIPVIGNAMAAGKEKEPYWKRFFAGYEPVKDWLAKVDSDIAIVVYNDHGLNFLLGKMPTFALGCADVYNNADEGWGLPTLSSFEGDAEFSWHRYSKTKSWTSNRTTQRKSGTVTEFLSDQDRLWP